MIYRGSCHCGAVRAAYESDVAVVLRQDGCGFCSARGVKSASDPNGRLTLESTLSLTRYRFGHKTAEFLICPRCGAFVAAQMDSPRGPVAVLNVVGVSIPELKDEEATFASLDGEAEDERIERRLSRWTPLVLLETATRLSKSRHEVTL